MSVEIKVPSLGESVVEATVAKWYKNEGDSVSVDEPLLELETDKVTLEVPSPSNGCIQKINAEEGSTVEVGAILGSIDENASIEQKVKQSEPVNEQSVTIPEKIIPEEVKSPPKEEMPIQIDNLNNQKLSPAVRKIAAEKNININTVTSSREDGRITKSDVINYQNIEKQENTPQTIRQTDKREERVPMSRLRQTIAKRLKDAQNNAAMLTTFNEVDMSELIKTRNDHKSEFEKKYGVKLGFMSFFVKACVIGLKNYPAINAEIQGEEIIYKNYYNISIAVGTDRGLVVPVIKETDEMSFGEIEKNISNLGEKAREGKITIDDLQGGTFTITNGGIYGSMLSTPILNPPQSAVLGMHNIVERPVVVDGSVEVRPIMYLALSYDHRIIDGKEAVSFLKIVKESLEKPQRLFLDI